MDDLLFFILISPFIGSFLGVVILRLPLGQGLVMGRSKCPECGHKLAFWHLAGAVVAARKIIKIIYREKNRDMTCGSFNLIPVLFC